MATEVKKNFFPYAWASQAPSILQTDKQVDEYHQGLIKRNRKFESEMPIVATLNKQWLIRLFTCAFQVV